MMMATCRATAAEVALAPPTGGMVPASFRKDPVSTGSLDLHDLLLFGFQGLVDPLYGLIGKVLHLGFELFMLVLGDVAVLFGLLQVFHGLASYIADGDLLLFGIFAGKLGEV